jgi:uncharacterized protein with NRDE domain
MGRCAVCTVILRVGAPDEAVRLLAVRDEDPARAWQPLGAWWPDRPGVVGVRDVRAGGAWLAADPAAGRLGVLLNRASPPVPTGVAPVSRGGIVLDAVAGRAPHPTAAVLGFNLVDVSRDGVRVVTWDGRSLRESEVPPGVHMIAHDDLDDPRTERIAAWHDAFAAAAEEADWERAWLEVLARSSRLGPDDDRAIIRDNRVHGYPTQSLLLCTASIGPASVDVRYGELARPGMWDQVALVPPVV